MSLEVPEVTWQCCNVSNDPISNPLRSGTLPGFNKFSRLPSDTGQTRRRPDMHTEDPTPLPCLSNPNLQLKVTDWKAWAYTDGSCHIKNGKQVIGAGVFHPSTNSIHLVDPNGAGITNSIPRAELAGIAAAINYN